MAKQLTLSEAVTRFSNLATTGIGIEDAIIEAVDRIYEMGRYPGTTVEIELAETDFIEGEEDGEWFIQFAEETYDGAIGFRNNSRGWAIVDHTVLYKDGLNAGDREFVDYGTIVSDGDDVLVSGTLSPDVTGPLYRELDEVTGFYGYLSGSTYPRIALVPISSPPADPDQWGLYHFPTESLVGSSYWTATYTPSVVDADDWAATSPATGTPVITFQSGSGYRKYRCPLGWVPSAGPYFALMKLEAPVLQDDTVIPIQSLSALKCAILAVCQEYVSDDERALLNWQKFDNLMTRSTRQVSGPKRFTMGIDCSLRRRPKGFM